MRNICMRVAYDGTHYLGWQRTSMGPSVEAALEEVLERFLRQKVSLQAASRTDAGVHARGQLVQFCVEDDSTDISRLQKSLNSMLPRDIAVWSLDVVPELIVPQGKEYRYTVCNGNVQFPNHRLYAWHFHYPLDLSLMQEATKEIVGTRDFSAFCNVKKGETYENYVRTVTKIEIEPLPFDRFLFKVTGDHFLYKMVRNIVGTLCYVGSNKILLSDVPEILLSKDRTRAGMTAPACGLVLETVF